MESFMFLGFSLDAWITIVTVLGMFSILLFTKLRSDVVFLGAIGVLFVTGVLDAKEAFSGFSGTSVITVGVLFVVVAGLTHTGVLQWIVKHLLGQPSSYAKAVTRLMLPVAVLSSFLSNTTVVALFVNIVKMWSKKLGISPSKLLIPLSYAGGMGGPLAAIATPSTLLLFGMYEKQTGESLGILASFLPALLCFATTTLALIAFRRLLPNRNSPEEAFAPTGDYTFEMLVTSDNPHIGKTIGELGLNRVQAGTLVELKHFDNEKRIMPVDDNEPLMGGDSLIFSGQLDDMAELAKKLGFVSPDQPC